MSTPLAVNTTDGLCWTRREVTRDGHELYALEAVKTCPAHLMETYAELVERGIAGSAHVLPVPVGSVEESSSAGYPPALPWARLLDADDLADFLDELAASAITHASSDVALAEVEETCGTWRLIAEAQHGHNTAPGPDRLTQSFAPVAAPREDDPTDVQCSKCGDPVHWVSSTNSDGGFWRHRFVPGRILDHFGEVAGSEGRHAFEVEYQGESDAKRRLPSCKACGRPVTHAVHDGDVRPQVRELRAPLAGQRASLEDPHDGPLAHKYLAGRDLPVPESCRLDADQVDEVSRSVWFGGGAQ